MRVAGPFPLVRGELVPLGLLAAVMRGSGARCRCCGVGHGGAPNFGSECLAPLAGGRREVAQFVGQQGKRGGTGGFHQLAERDCQGARGGGGGGVVVVGWQGSRGRGRVVRGQVKGQVLMQFHACVDEVLR